MIFSQQIEKYVAAKVLPPVEGKITFAEVSFGYLGIDILFSALNLEIQQDETIAATGENGAGKSLMLHL